MNTTVTIVQGDPVIDVWAPVTDADDLAGYPALEADLHLFNEGRMIAWMIEMDTKYCGSEPVAAPYAPVGKFIARFTLPEDSWDAAEGADVATDFVFEGLPEDVWTMRVLGGRYDHLVVFTRKD